MFNKEKYKQVKKASRHRRVRSKVIGTSIVPRLSVFRSNKGMYLQLIDDSKHRTLVSAGVKEIKDKKIKKLVMAHDLGVIIAKKAIKINIQKIVFDKGGYKYHGRVKAVADGARDGGLQF